MESASLLLFAGFLILTSVEVSGGELDIPDPRAVRTLS